MAFVSRRDYMRIKFGGARGGRGGRRRYGGYGGRSYSRRRYYR